MLPIHHQPFLFLIYLCWIGHAAGAAGGTQGQARTSTTTTRNNIAEAEAAGLDHHARETLCSNQIAMCAVSCQNNILANTWSVHLFVKQPPSNEKKREFENKLTLDLDFFKNHHVSRIVTWKHWPGSVHVTAGPACLGTGNSLYHSSSAERNSSYV